jgi:hypothetical protein
MHREPPQSPSVQAPKYDDPGRGPLGATPNLAMRTIIGIFPQRPAAEQAAAALRRAGHAIGDVAIVERDAGAAPARSADDTRAWAGTTRGAMAGAALGGILGLLASVWTQIGVSGVPEPLLLAGTGAMVGGALGALGGSFAGLGTPTRRAQRDEAATRAGGVQVALQVADEAAAERAQAELRRLGAHGVESYQPSL